MNSIHLFYRQDNELAAKTASDLTKWLKKTYPNLKFDAKKPQLVVALGGDGTILEAARNYQAVGAEIVGFNLGTTGFLATAQDPKEFKAALKTILAGNYHVVERMMIEAEVLRAGKSVFSSNALNDIVVLSPLNIVDLEVQIDGHPYQYIRGTGVLIATATGSTAFNLSAHGPIVMPDIKCMVLTELLDHNLPTPSLVIGPDRLITINVVDFRTQKTIKLAEDNKPADVVLSVDGNNVFALAASDQVTIKKSDQHSLFIQIDKSQFFKTLQDKFALK